MLACVQSLSVTPSHVTVSLSLETHTHTRAHTRERRGALSLSLGLRLGIVKRVPKTASSFAERVTPLGYPHSGVLGGQVHDDADPGVHAARGAVGGREHALRGRRPPLLDGRLRGTRSRVRDEQGDPFEKQERGFFSFSRARRTRGRDVRGDALALDDGEHVAHVAQVRAYTFIFCVFHTFSFKKKMKMKKIENETHFSETRRRLG